LKFLPPTRSYHLGPVEWRWWCHPWVAVNLTREWEPPPTKLAKKDSLRQGVIKAKDMWAPLSNLWEAGVGGWEG
jgi:hypothetical protein